MVPLAWVNSKVLTSPFLAPGRALVSGLKSLQPALGLPLSFLAHGFGQKLLTGPRFGSIPQIYVVGDC